MRFGRLDLNLLVALDVLIEERSVSAAAKRLNLSQPALSGALNRLREYFEDDLLTQSGRHMILTPKAQELSKPVSDALLLIGSRITTSASFDPATTDRNFSIISSDFAFQVLLSEVIARASILAPGLTFEIIAADKRSTERVERGEVDLLVTISDFISDRHPNMDLFEDEHAIICWAEGKHSKGIDEDGFFAAGHAIAYFGADRFPAFTETYFAQEGANRRIELRLPTFSELPLGIIGTDRIATIYRRHAEYFASILPIKVLPMPFPMPNVVEKAQWHTMRDNDEGLKWILSLLKCRAQEISI